MARALRQRQQNQVICVCCVCGEARDDIAADGAWYSLEAQLNRYGMHEQDLMFSHTFCPDCFMHCKELIGLAPRRAAQVTTVVLGSKQRTMNRRV
jgi:hypothetical protein